MFAVPRSALWVAAFTALLAAARFARPPYQETGPAASSEIPAATPPGITLQPRTGGARTRVATAAQTLIADSRGMSLYTYDKDIPGGRPACSGECARARPAALAPSGAAPDGDFSLLARADGMQQWVYRGAPLYRFANDKAIGDALGDEADGGAWHAALFDPGARMSLPDGIAVREIADAGGTGLVDASLLTLYTFDAAATQRGPACTRDCPRLWLPLEAPAIANPAGFFSVIARDDGITQWAFRGRPLYRFAGDRKPGDVNGSAIDERFHVALLARFFMPEGITIRRSVELGDILMTKGGATLYQRDRVTSEELHQFRTDHGEPALGRILGTSTCGPTCAQIWPPFIAPAGAQPSGYWEIATRSDGARQWVYKGFALYTYSADKPGETNGNAIYDLERVGGTVAAGGDPPIVPNDVAVPGAGVGAMFWRAVVP